MSVSKVIKNKQPSLEKRDNRVGIYFLLPSIIVLLVIVAYPVIYSFVMSFHRWRPIETQRPFVGLANYLRVVTDSRFFQSIINTFIYAIAGACLKVLLGFGLAII